MRPASVTYRPRARTSLLRLIVHTGRQATAYAQAPAESAGTKNMSTSWAQKKITLKPRQRGCHVITRELVAEMPELQEFDMGLANIWILHTSASLTINENASRDVPLDLADALDRLAPEGTKMQYRHDDEGPDDMPAHIKSSLMGPGLTVPVSKGRLALGTWQGVYLNEHRDYGGSRSVIITVQGQKRSDGRSYGPQY